MGGPSLDQRANRRGHQAVDVRSERPHAVDLLDHPVVAVRVRELLDDERHAFCLGMDGRGARAVDLAAQEMPKQLGGLELTQPADLQPTHQTHAFHVGDQRDRLVDERGLFRPHRRHQEQLQIRPRADQVAKKADAVLVCPLEVVDQDRDRGYLRQLSHRERGQVERTHELLIRREIREARVVVPRYRVDRPVQPRFGRRPLRRPLCLGRGQDAAREQEWPADLLVGHNPDRHEAVGRRDLGGGEEQPRLPDARLALEREAGERRVGRADRLLHRSKLERPADDRLADPANMKAQRAQRLDIGRKRQRFRAVHERSISR